MSQRIVLATWGSLGDLHPYLAVGLVLKHRGYEVTIATSDLHQEKVEQEGLGYARVRPDQANYKDDPHFMANAMHRFRGTEFIVRHVLMPHVQQTYEDLFVACQGADLVVSHVILYPLPMVIEQLQQRWITAVLQPALFLSEIAPPMLVPWPSVYRYQLRHPWLTRTLFGFAKAMGNRWVSALTDLRKRQGLPETSRHPMFEDVWSPYGVHAWFSPLLAEKQPDWPTQVEFAGFPRYDQLHPGESMREDLRAFLDNGPPPVVFTLGSSAVFTAKDFFEESLKAVCDLNCRAVFLLGPEDANTMQGAVPPTVFLGAYAPYSELFPRAAAIVHQGGVGTTAQSMYSGRPSLVVPYSHDQPDNAARLERLGCSRVLSRPHYKARRVKAELNALLSDPAYARRAAAIGEQIGTENGAERAADLIEAALRTA